MQADLTKVHYCTTTDTFYFEIMETNSLRVFLAESKEALLAIVAKYQESKFAT